MSLDVSTVGYTTEPYVFEYDWKTVVLYALGIGAKKDELEYLYEAKGPKVYPTFAVVPVFPVLGDTLSKTQGNLAMVVHGGQIVRMHQPIPSEGKLETVRYLLGAVISLGFIGTLIGLSSSIGMAHLAKTVEGMPEITRNLNVAFDTTLVALLTGLVLNFFYHRYLENLDTFYSRTKAYIIDNLISRIYKAAA